MIPTTKLAPFGKLLVSCPITKLGSLLHIAPSFDMLINAFGERTIIMTSPQAIYLNKYRFADAKSHGASIFGCDEPGRDKMIREQIADKTIVCLPFGDSFETVDDSFFSIVHLVDKNSYRIGYDGFLGNLRTNSDDEEHGWDLPSHIFDHVVNTSGNAIPEPNFLNTYLETARMAVMIDDPSMDFQIPGTMRRPLVWTSEKEVAQARLFFEKERLCPKNTIGIHLTSATHDSFNSVWPFRNYYDVAIDFIKKGYHVLLVSGNIFGTHPAHDDKDFSAHKHLLDALNKTFPRTSGFGRSSHLFFGDCLTSAEIIRNCTAVLSPNSGPAHLAAAVGTPKVSIIADDFEKKTWLWTSDVSAGFQAQEKYSGRSDRSMIISPKPAQIIEALEMMIPRSPHLRSGDNKASGKMS
ncbi:MAG: hypothetical protein NTZ10_03915 [Candidatus Saganbacteria bacterium]|nr:hypothetical protein [Candidatus Saganbacteria bacterium]